ncbi:MAG: hydroxymethylglutaryl-CoA lyase [Bacteroidota bacterium]
MKRVANIIECPRDAMQGIKEFIQTEKKIKYIQSLLSCGFHSIDFGSFVSPKAIPQMADTVEVLEGLDLSKTSSKLLAIVANARGIEQAASFKPITYLGFPLSLSETFQHRNTNASIADALLIVDFLSDTCAKTNKTPVVYLSMGFGNPYGDEWNTDIVLKFSEIMFQKGIQIISLADTIGIAQPEHISYLFDALIPAYTNIEFGAHFHTTPNTWEEKIDAAWQSGCSRFDGAIKGYGGCPMATDDLTGNMPTEKMLSYFQKNNIETGVDDLNFTQAMMASSLVFDHI